MSLLSTPDPSFLLHKHRGSIRLANTCQLQNIRPEHHITPPDKALLIPLLTSIFHIYEQKFRSEELFQFSTLVFPKWVFITILYKTEELLKNSWGSEEWVRYLTCKHKALNLGLQHPCKKDYTRVHLCSALAGSRQADQDAIWSSNLAEMVSPSSGTMNNPVSK